MSKIKGKGKASGKIILIGEHSVVYGEPAIGVPLLNTNVIATIKKSEINFLRCIQHNGPFSEIPVSLNSIRLLTMLLQKDLETENFDLTVKSNIPYERGMGSSAAVSTAITRSFFDWKKLLLTQDKLLYYTNYSEKINHGNPSGIDAISTANIQPIFFAKDQGFKKLVLNINCFLLVADTGIKSKTSDSIKSIEKLYKYPKNKTYIQNLGKLAKLARKSLKYNKPEELGKIMNLAQKYLELLGVSHSKVNYFLRIAQENGALGVKITGGGFGGCFIVLLKTKKDAQKMSKILLMKGIKKTWIQKLGDYENV